MIYLHINAMQEDIWDIYNSSGILYIKDRRLFMVFFFFAGLYKYKDNVTPKNETKKKKENRNVMKKIK